MLLRKFFHFILLNLVFSCFAFSQTVYVGKDPYSETNKLRREREMFLREFSALILVDKKNPNYTKVLENVVTYPQIHFKKTGNDYQLEFDKYVLSLLPYMLTKLKQKDLNGEFPLLYRALTLSKDMKKNMILTFLQEASYNFIYQALQTEKSLRACSQMMSEYQDKKAQIDIQLSRIDVLESAPDKYMTADLKKMKQDLYFLNSNLIGNLENDNTPKLFPATNHGRMPASVIAPEK